MSWILEVEIEELKEKLKRIETLVIESKENNKEIQPNEVLDIINE
jgi:hypothetical protein